MDITGCKATPIECTGVAIWQLRRWIKVQENECWLWDKPGQHARYGMIRNGDLVVAVHRLSYAYYNGPIPDKFEVLHACDNTRCVNPDHLFTGTHKDNMRDASKKQRWSKFTKEEIQTARAVKAEARQALRSLIHALKYDPLKSREALAKSLEAAKTAIDLALQRIGMTKTGYHKIERREKSA